MSSEELNISTALQKTPAKSRKRKTDSKESDEDSPPPPVFGKIGTPMVATTVRISDGEGWDEFKEREWRKMLRNKWDLTESKLPRVSDSEHLRGRKEHYAMIKKAQEDVCANLDAINEMNFNVGRGKAINIQCNGKDVPEKQSKKFQKAVEKALKEMGNPTMEQMMTDDLDEDEAREEAEFAKRFKKKSAKARRRMEDIREFEEGHRFDPWEEYLVEMEDQNESHKVSEENFKKWLKMKVDENKVHENYLAYQLELLNMDKDALSNRKTLKTMVKGVQNFYRNLRNKK